MTASGQKGQRSLKVPRENNSFLCSPSAVNTPEILRQNQFRLHSATVPSWIRTLQVMAKSQAIQASAKYTANYASGFAQKIPALDSKLIVGGHQPELFHPGVWFKNFLLAKIAVTTSAASLHVIIDHDLARSDSLRVPVRNETIQGLVDHGQFIQESIQLPIREEGMPRLPWHLTSTKSFDLSRWKYAVEKTRKALTSCGLLTPIIEDRFALLIQCIENCDNYSDAFSQFRHQIELDHGIQNWEVPLGHLCSESAFGEFVHHSVSSARSLWQAYNQCRLDYRHRHSIRNQAQPVPELLHQNESLELPFWLYRTDVSSFTDRKRLWVSIDSNSLGHDHILHDHPDSTQRTITAHLPRDVKQLPEAWKQITTQGICIRPRALMTTAYLRCFVSDLFVHGIGGGVYDELTDAIIETWLGIEPPEYLTCSASLHLEFPSAASTGINELRETQRELHLMRSVPERFLDRTQIDQKILYDRHLQLLSNVPKRGAKQNWHEEIVRSKTQIDSAIEHQKRLSSARLQSLSRKLQQDKIVNSREYSFCLFPQGDVVSRLDKLACQAIGDAS